MFISTLRAQITPGLRRSSQSLATPFQQRSFMSTQSVEAPEVVESHFLLILGPPGGGKGTLCKKMLAVCQSMQGEQSTRHCR